MSQTLVQSVSGNSPSSSTSVTGTLGAGATAGNIIWCAVGIDKTSGALTTPSGFTTLFVGSGLLVGAVFLFTQQVVTRLTQEVATTSRVLARFCAQASFPAVSDPELQRIFAEVIAHVDFPIVITDTEGT